MGNTKIDVRREIIEREKAIARLQDELTHFRAIERIMVADAPSATGDAPSGRSGPTMADAVDKILRAAEGRPMSFDSIAAEYAKSIGKNKIENDRSLRNVIYKSEPNMPWKRERIDGVVTWRFVSAPEQGSLLEKAG
jgi:hypothetical protein